MEFPLIFLVCLVTTASAQTTESNSYCGNTFFNDSYGYVTSPYFPSYYGSNQDCSYILGQPQQSPFIAFNLYFQHFDLEGDCGHDWLEISCLVGIPYGPYKYCGIYTSYYVYIDGCSQVLLWFHSDATNNYPGFNIQYEAYGAEVATTQAPEAGTVTAYDPACGQNSFTDFHGVISSPNYPGSYNNDLYCDYYVYATTGGSSSFSFIFTSFHVETPDFLTISCSYNSEAFQHEYSGHSLPYPASIPSCSQARINFRTDYPNVSSGFSIDYYVSDEGCGNTLFIGPTGFVNSPHWPEFYRYNENCTNIIWAPEQSRIKIYFHFFNLESNCSSDWLEISCLDNSAYGVQRFCGNYNFHNFSITDCSQVLLSFHSDDINNYQGFNIEYTIYQNTGCGNTAFFDPSGVITSPNYPGNYTNFLYCQYNTYSSLRSGVLFIFTAFLVQYENDFVIVRCVSNNYFKHLYTGNEHPRPILFQNCSQGAIELHTDHNVVSSGFSVDYYINVGDCGNTLHDSNSGSVTSPNWPSNYGYSQNCSNIIWAPERSTFYLNIQSFILQNCCTCDWLEISCQDNSDYGPNRFCGFHDPVDLYIYNCSQVLLWFHSDESGNDQGFNIEYNVIYPDAGDGKVPSNRKPNADETMLDNGKQHAGESVPRDGKLSAEDNAPSNGNRNAAENVVRKRQPNAGENAPSN